MTTTLFHPLTLVSTGLCLTALLAGPPVASETRLTVDLDAPAAEAFLPAAPVCIPGPSQNVVCQGSSTVVQLDASASFDPDGDPLTFLWQACPGATLSDETSPTPTLTLDTSVTCVTSCGVRLRVSDGKESSFGRMFVSTFAPVCDVPGLIGSNFNGTSIPAGGFVWFNAIVKVSGVSGTSPVTINVHDSRIQFTNSGTNYDLPVPESVITFSPAVTCSSTTFDTATNRWHTTVPINHSGNVFLAGLSFPVPANLAGGTNPVTWHANFSSANSGLSFQWKWAAAVYTQFSADHSLLEVKPVDGGQCSPYMNNSDHAGTPESFKPFVTGGARGGGGSNFTGSYSSTKTVGC